MHIVSLIIFSAYFCIFYYDWTNQFKYQFFYCAIVIMNYWTILIVLIVGVCIYYILTKNTDLTKKRYIFTFIYDDRQRRYMIHGLWLDTTVYCDNYTYDVPYDPNKFIKHNWYDRNLNAKENTLFKYEYIKHGTCLGLNSTNYLKLIEQLYKKYYDKHVLRNKSNKKEIWLYLDENYDLITVRSFDNNSKN